MCNTNELHCILYALHTLFRREFSFHHISEILSQVSHIALWCPCYRHWLMANVVTLGLLRNCSHWVWCKLLWPLLTLLSDLKLFWVFTCVSSWSPEFIVKKFQGYLLSNWRRIIIQTQFLVSLTNTMIERRFWVRGNHSLWILAICVITL